MLHNLYVKNLALIDEIEVEFKHGLNILTGETGAGKSIIMGSVNLALGGKADKSLVFLFLHSKTLLGFICSFILGSPQSPQFGSDKSLF